MGTWPGLEDKEISTPGDSLFPYAILDSKSQTLVSGSSPHLWKGKLFCLHCWWAGFTHCYSFLEWLSAVQTPGWVTGPPLGKLTLKAYPTWAHKGHQVTCSELPGHSYSLLHPQNKLWRPFHEPSQPKRKNPLSRKYQIHGAKRWY